MKVRSHLLLLVLSLFTLPINLLGAGGTQERPPIDEEPMWRNPQSVKVLSREMAFTDESFSHPKNDNIFFLSRFNDGWVLMISFFRINTLIFDSWGAYVAVSDPEGRSFWTTHEMNPRDVPAENMKAMVQAV